MQEKVKNISRHPQNITHTPNLSLPPHYCSTSIVFYSIDNYNSSSYDWMEMFHAVVIDLFRW